MTYKITPSRSFLGWLVIGLASLSLAQPTVIPANKAVVTVSIQVEKKPPSPHGLGPEAVKLFEDGKQQQVLSLLPDDRPLSIMMVFLSGNAGNCGFQAINQPIAWLSVALRKKLQEKDELGVAVTDPKGQILLPLSEKRDRWSEMFGEGNSDHGKMGSGRITEISYANSRSYTAFQARQKSGSSYEQEISPVPTSIWIAPENHLFKALQNAVAALKERTADNYPVILIVNTLYNTVSVSPQEQQELLNLIRQEQISVHWIGAPISCCFTPIKAPIQYNDFNYYNQLIKETGGRVFSCEMFQPDGNWGPRNNQKDVDKEMQSLFDTLRHRYRLQYSSVIPIANKQQRRIKIEIAAKWGGDKAVLHYPKVISPLAAQK